MIKREHLLKLIESGFIKVGDFHAGNVDDDGGLQLTINTQGHIVQEISSDTFDEDPREIVVNLYKEELPYEPVDLNTQKILFTRSMIVVSNERIVLPESIYGFVVPEPSLLKSLSISSATILNPGYDGKITLQVTNPWEYPVYLEPNKPIAKVFFFPVSSKAWLTFVKPQDVTTGFLFVAHGIFSNNSTYRTLRPGRITAMSAQLANSNSSVDFQVYVNGVIAPEAKVVVENKDGNAISDLNVIFNPNDKISVKAVVKHGVPQDAVIITELEIL